MDLGLGTAKAAGHILVDFHDHILCGLADGGKVRRAGTEVEVAVLIHGGYLDHGHVGRFDKIAVVARQLRVAQRNVEGEAFIDGLPLNAAHVPGVPAKMIGGIRNIENGGLPEHDPAADLDILKLRHAGGERLVQGYGMPHAPAVVDPVAGFNDLDRLFGNGQFFLI